MLFKSHAQTNQQIPCGQRVKEFPRSLQCTEKGGNTELFTDLCSKGQITVQKKAPSLRARMVTAASRAKRALEEFSYMKGKAPRFL